jgi:hypothetical protein
MLRPESSMRSDAGLDELHALDEQCQRLQLLVGELLLKNHELRCEVGRLRDAKEKKLQMPPPRYATSEIIFDWERIS